MKVLAGPRVDLAADGPAARLCRQLAGDGGEVVFLAALGVGNPYRGFSAAEVEVLRGALRGQTGVIGYVCAGVALAGDGRQAVSANAGGLVVVTDHVNLTWRSPLAGPNDDTAGPRFPSMDGAYAPDAALRPGTGEDGMIVVRGVVAGVSDDRVLSAYETQTGARLGWAAASSELVAPVILAVHMGLRVAAVVMV